MTERRRHLTLVGVMLALIGGVWLNNERGINAIARQTHDGLCALRDDVQRRHDATVEYLEENPLGVVSPKTGAIIITAAQLRQSLDNQASTLAALDESGLVC